MIRADLKFDQILICLENKYVYKFHPNAEPSIIIGGIVNLFWFWETYFPAIFKAQLLFQGWLSNFMMEDDCTFKRKNCASKI